MKKTTLLLLTFSLLAIFMFSCRKTSSKSSDDSSLISANVLHAILAKGFDTTGIAKVNGGYRVEGDIFLSYATIGDTTSTNLIIAKNEQYRTTNLITGLPRNITISLTNLPAAYTAAVDEAIARYAAANLRITFQRVAAGGAINITNGNLLIFFDPDYCDPNSLVEGASGTPDASGNPWTQIGLNVNFMGQAPNQDFLATIIAHEMGHCIGFRHTDYMNRAFSCNTGGLESDPNNIGAINIPGTPTGPEAGSWMLACNGFVDRPFNANDLIALHYLYDFENAYAWQQFGKQGCAPGYQGSWVQYNVPAGRYFSSLSQADADAQALAEIAANGQNNANTNGVCNLGVSIQVYAAGFNASTGAKPSFALTDVNGNTLYQSLTSSSGVIWVVPGTYNIQIVQTNNKSFTVALPPQFNSTSGQVINFNGASITQNTTCYVTDK